MCLINGFQTALIVWRRLYYIHNVYNWSEPEEAPHQQDCIGKMCVHTMLLVHTDCMCLMNGFQLVEVVLFVDVK